MRSCRNDGDGYLDDFAALQAMALFDSEGRILEVSARSPDLGECLNRRLGVQSDATPSAIIDCGLSPMLLVQSTASDGDRREGVAGLYEFEAILAQQIAALDPTTPIRLRSGDRVLLSRGMVDGLPVSRPIVLDQGLSAEIGRASSRERV